MNNTVNIEAALLQSSYSNMPEPSKVWTLFEFEKVDETNNGTFYVLSRNLFASNIHATLLFRSTMVSVCILYREPLF